MSLDVCLNIDQTRDPRSGSGIYVRRNGRTVEISRDEWDDLYPGREPVVVAHDAETSTLVYSGNITHNLNKMAEKAGIYDYLWRPDENGISRASELIEPLARGLAKLTADPEAFKRHNPPNGWGDYHGLVAFVAEYLDACIRFPDASVSVWR